MKSKLLKILLSLTIAFGLWLYVVTVVSPGSETTVEDIPVQVRGGTIDKNSGLIVFADAELIITDRINQEVTLELAGNRIDLNKLNNNNIFVYLDVSKINEVGPNQPLGYEVDLSGVVSNSAVTVTKRTPGTIQVDVEKWSKDEVPVKEPEISVAEGYHLVESELEYDESIMISGPDRIVSKIAYAKIQPLENQTASIKSGTLFAYELYNEDGKRLSEDDTALLSDTQDTFGKIEVSATIKQKRTISIENLVQMTAGGGLTESDVTITFAPAEITVYGSEDELDGLVESIRKWNINLAQITDGQTGELTSLFLKEVGFVNEEEAVEQIRFEIHYNDNIAEKNLTIRKFTVEGAVPSGKEAVVLNQSLKITVRGPEDLIKDIEAEDITAVVTYNASGDGEVTIHISEDYSGVGVVDTGKHTVNVTLREKQRENLENQNRRG